MDLPRAPKGARKSSLTVLRLVLVLAFLVMVLVLVLITYKAALPQFCSGSVALFTVVRGEIGASSCWFLVVS